MRDVRLCIWLIVSVMISIKDLMSNLLIAKSCFLPTKKLGRGGFERCGYPGQMEGMGDDAYKAPKLRPAIRSGVGKQRRTKSGY